jgi:hypothetical protein
MQRVVLSGSLAIFAAIRRASLARGVSRSFATFLLCYVDGEAIEQEGN